MNNKWVRAAFPALLIHCSIGSVYCWSTFKETIANKIGMSTFSVGWAFSFAIFFLGMSAAFAGKMVERDIKKSSLISCICFVTGMLGTGFFIQFTSGVVALVGIYVCYGVIMGIGLGIGYLTPVKTLMLWFHDQKGLATGLSIMGFGLAKAIATPFMELIQNSIGIVWMFYILGFIYLMMMFLGHKIIKKPDGWVEPEEDDDYHFMYMFKNKMFVGIWIMFFLNIHCGLALITYEKQIVQTSFAQTAILVAMISIVPSMTAAFNALGRIGYSTISDKMRDRNNVYKIIFSSCTIISVISLFTSSITDGNTSGILQIITVALLILVNLGYGGGFSTLPALLSCRFGMEKISKIHGLALSAWAFAGLTGNNMSELILKKGGGYEGVLVATASLYAVALIICTILVTDRSKKELQ